MLSRFRTRLAAGIVLLALVILPAPLLPPNRFAEAVQSALGIGWKTAYLVTAIGLQTAFYLSLGVVAALAVNRVQTWRGRLPQILILPLVMVGSAIVIRSVKLGYVPMLANAIIPIAACVLGAGLGLILVYRGWKLTLLVAAAVVGATLWAFLGGTSAELSRATETRLRQLVAAAPALPAGEARFGALLETAFHPLLADTAPADAVQQNRAALLALGIVAGHERVARFVGLNPDGELVRAAVALREGVRLRGREDWSRPKAYA